MDKKIILPAIAIGTLAIAGAAWFGSSQVKAASANRDTLIDDIATKFNLPKDQLEATFDEHKTEMQKERQVEQDAKLDQALTDGVITAEQKDKIIAKRNELRAVKQQNREEMRMWMKDNRIDESKLHDYMGGGRGMKGGRGGMGGHGMGDLEG